MAINTVTDSSFSDDVLNASDPVLVDFWATWCGPCRQIAPSLEEMAAEFSGKMNIVKMDIDENPETPGQYGVRGVPTLMIFKNGDVLSTSVGAKSKSQLVAWAEEAIASAAA